MANQLCDCGEKAESTLLAAAFSDFKYYRRLGVQIKAKLTNESERGIAQEAKDKNHKLKKGVMENDIYSQIGVQTVTDWLASFAYALIKLLLKVKNQSVLLLPKIKNKCHLQPREESVLILCSTVPLSSHFLPIQAKGKK